MIALRSAPGINTLDYPFLLSAAAGSLTLKANTDIKLIDSGNHYVSQIGASALILTLSAILDTGSVQAGLDYYIYLCRVTATTSVIKASLNSSYPSGFTAENSRKIGGLHTLCVGVGTVSGHPLTGYAAGAILPNSVWCLNHLPESAAAGMVFDSGTGKWVDIYLASVSGGLLASIYNAAFATGATSPAFHWYNFSQWLAGAKKRMFSQHEFQSLSLGSNQGTNITGSVNPVYCGGHTDTSARRMISNIGCEDCCGVLWQWGNEAGAGGSAAWENAYDANDSGVGGQHYLAPNRPLFGGSWDAAAFCGSRGSNWHYAALYLASNCGVRGVAEPKNT